MEDFIETIKRKTTCNPEKDKKCKCKDHLESGIDGNKPHYTNKRVCEKEIN